MAVFFLQNIMTVVLGMTEVATKEEEDTSIIRVSTVCTFDISVNPFLSFYYNENSIVNFNLLGL